MNTDTKNRNPAFDVAKFLAMLLVVAGHLTGNSIVECVSGVSYLSNANIGVSMPLFFMLSGYFAAKTLDAGDDAKIVARIVGFLWPLAAFGVAFALILLACGKLPVWKATLYPVARVWCGSWFLSTLAAIFVIAAIIFRFVKNDRNRWFAFALIYVGLFFSAGQGKIASFLRLTSIIHMFPYFVFGMMALKPYELYKKALVAIPCGIFLLLVVFFEGDVRTNGMAFYWVPSDWQTVLADKHLLLCFFARTAVGIAGGIFFLWVVDKLVKTLPQLSSLAVFGTSTLGVYVMHEWPLIQIHKYLQFGPLPSYWRWPLVFALYFACHYLTVLIRRYPKSKFFFFGDERRLAAVIDAWRSKCFSR